MQIVKSEFFGFDNGNSVQRIIGFCESTETKPTTNIRNGSKLTELDTGDVYFFDEDSGWEKVNVGEGGSSGSGGVLVVNVVTENETSVLDKNYNEIVAALEAGNVVMLLWDDGTGMYYVYYCTGNYVVDGHYTIQFHMGSTTKEFTATSATGVLALVA